MMTPSMSVIMAMQKQRISDGQLPKLGEMAIGVASLVTRDGPKEQLRQHAVSMASAHFSHNGLRDGLGISVTSEDMIDLYHQYKLDMGEWTQAQFDKVQTVYAELKKLEINTESVFSISCLCGLIQYELRAEPFDCCYCHCSICRKLTGAAYGAYGSVAKADFSWTLGEASLTTYIQNENTRRLFCSGCGSYLLTTYTLEPQTVFVTLGSLDADAVSISYQQFVDSKATWCKIDKNIRMYEDWPD